MSRTRELLQETTEEQAFKEFLRDLEDEEYLEHLQSNGPFNYFSEGEDLKLTLKHCF